MISFDNTEVAYLNKTNKDIVKAKLLFKLFASPRFVPVSKRLLKMAIYLNLPIDWMIRPTIYRLFVGGQTYSDCLPYVRLLNQQNLKSVLQYAIDNQFFNKNLFHDNYLELKSLIQKSDNSNEIAFNVFKPSNLIDKEILIKANQNLELTPNEAQALDRFNFYVEDLCKESAGIGKPILVDAEESWCQSYVDELIFGMMEKYNQNQCIVFNTLQMYRTDRLQYLFNIHNKAKQKGFLLGIKLVRGAYMDKERWRAEKLGYASPIHETKADTDRDFNEAIKYIAYNIETISLVCGTHNEDSVNYLACLMDADSIDNNDPRIFFSQLYGMGDYISFNLAIDEYNVLKSIPYGPPKMVLSYLIRRAEENSIDVIQTGREITMLKLELTRRKSTEK